MTQRQDYEPHMFPESFSLTSEFGQLFPVLHLHGHSLLFRLNCLFQLSCDSTICQLFYHFRNRCLKSKLSFEVWIRASLVEDNLSNAVLDQTEVGQSESFVIHLNMAKVPL